ncbi:hypothetical protein [Pseudoroseicyclus aestuarii]|uniref:hypothetical protein n=1 Tax=Pseudoroseicyclus aestuarii TaxID=1795041 RepID=UPI000DA1E90C|nr:hypothetical protein [Pseudoroseicyclus aestuarii]
MPVVSPTTLGPTSRTARPAARSRRAPSAPVDAARIERALQVVAALVVENPAYLPIFERLEAELVAAQAKDAAIDRARALLLRGRQQAERSLGASPASALLDTAEPEDGPEP